MAIVPKEIQLEDINQFIKFSKDYFSTVIIPDDFSKLPNYFIPKDLIICKQARESLNSRILTYANSKVNIFSFST